MPINQVLHARTALPENTKMQSLSNEVIRRMRNTSELLDSGTRVRIIDNFAQKMKNSSYKLDIIRRGVESQEDLCTEEARRQSK